MNRYDIIEKIGRDYQTSNKESGEYSYIAEAGSREILEEKVGHKVNHFNLDIRFETDDIVILVETRQSFVPEDEKQLKEYWEEEKALHIGKKIICILANTNDDKIKVWKSEIDENHYLSNETVLENMAYYKRL